MKTELGFGVSIEQKPEAFVIDNSNGQEVRIGNKGGRYLLDK